MAGTTYQELLDGVANYYGSGSDQWAEIARYGVNQQTIPIIERVPGVTVTVSNSGKYLGYDYTNPFADTVDPAATIDSNVQTGAYGAGAFNAQLPATAVTDPATGTTTMRSGANTVSIGSTVATIADTVHLAIVGVSLGAKLGKLIDSGIYAIDPEWWDTHYPTINPQTWDDIATTQGGKSFIRSIFGLENDDMTMYLDENLLAYTYLTLLSNGGYSTGASTATIDNPTTALWQAGSTDVPFNFNSGSCQLRTESNGGTNWNVLNNQSAVYHATLGTPNTAPVFFSDKPFVVELQQVFPGGAVAWSSASSAAACTYNGITFYVWDTSSQWTYGSILMYDPAPAFNPIPSGSYPWATAWNIEYCILNGTTHTESDLPGVSDNPAAGEYVNPTTLINPTTGQPVTPDDNIDDVLQALQTQYPDLFSGSIYEDVPQPDGTTQRITYIPVPYPDTTAPQQPVTDTTPGIDPQTNPQINPNTRTAELIQQLIDTLTRDPTPPVTGDGNTPSAIIPAGSANALYSIYNPTQGELNSFGAWLWSSNFVDQLLKLFNDPMQAIIGLHKVFAQPAISGASTIKVGYLDSGVSSNVVGNQYTTIDCGSVDVSEYFGNVFDYDPYTQIYIYLPFVGIEKLDTGDVMRGTVGVKYHVDVLTGACLAEITVTRDGAGGILYTFAGNCAVQYPISAGSYMGIVASLTSIAGGIVGTIASGGSLAPVTMGAVSGIMNAHTRVNHSGAFSGNAGAMGVKNPYLIITRPQTCLAVDFPAFDGYPANKTTTLSACSGFVKCATCHVENIPATDTELSEIEMLLKGGIII